MFLKSGEVKRGKSTDFFKLLLRFISQIGNGNNIALKKKCSEKAGNIIVKVFLLYFPAISNKINFKYYSTRLMIDLSNRMRTQSSAPHLIRNLITEFFVSVLCAQEDPPFEIHINLGKSAMDFYFHKFFVSRLLQKNGSKETDGQVLCASYLGLFTKFLNKYWNF